MPIWLPLLLCTLAVIYFLLDRGTSPRAASGDLALFIRRVDLRTLEDLLDPVAEAQLRADLSAKSFRRVQRGRIRAAREQIGRITHNARIFRAWSAEEYRQIATKNRAHFGDQEEMVIAVMRLSDEVKRASVAASWKLAFWRGSLVHLWAWMPSPSLSDVREVMGKDLLNVYESLITSAGQLLLTKDGEEYEAVRSAL